MYPGTFAAADPDRPAVIMATTGEVITYAELDAEANRLSHVFRAAGLQQGDHVALCLENSSRFLPVVWGAHYAGLYYTAMSSRLTTEEMAYIIDDCGAQAFVTSAYKAEQAAELRDQMPRVELRLMIDGVIDGFDRYETVLAAQPPTPLPEDRVEGQDMLYSSGTTGPAEGGQGAACREHRWARAPTASPGWRSSCSAPTSRPATSRPPRCTTRHRCASAAPRTASAAPWW